MSFQTTAIYPNRIEDKKLLESKLKLSEQGNNYQKFYFKDQYKENRLIAKGYERIVYEKL